MTQHNPEARKARALIAALLRDGGTVSIYDGEEFSIKQSRDEAAICAELGATDEETIYTYFPNGAPRGWLDLVYGNAADGSELIADYAGTEFLRGIVSEGEIVA